MGNHNEGNDSELDKISKQLAESDPLINTVAGGDANDELKRYLDETERFSSAAMGSLACEQALRQAQDQDRFFDEILGASAVDDLLKSAGGQHAGFDPINKDFLTLAEIERSAGLGSASEMLGGSNNPFEDILRENPEPPVPSLDFLRPPDFQSGFLEREKAVEARHKRLENISKKHLEVSAKQYEDYQKDLERQKVDSNHQKRYNRLGIAIFVVAVLSAIFQPDEIRSVFVNIYSLAKSWGVALIDFASNL